MRRLIRAFLLLALASCSREADTNIARYRAATASSNYDFNLTAQLLTDGIIHDGEPAFLELTSSDGPVGRAERENALDGDLNSRNIVTGSSGWLEWRFHGYGVEADQAEVLCQEALAGGRGGPARTMTVPVSVTESGALRIELTFPHAARWRVKNVEFYHRGKRLERLLPSEHFTSAWMSEGTEDEWVQVDLGRVRRVNAVRPHWLEEPKTCSVQVSRDGETWKAFRPGRWRYVKLRMHNESPRRFCLTELEVLGPDRGKVPADGWKIRRASEVPADGAVVSSEDFDTRGWLPAKVPGTVLANFLRAGAVPDPAYGDQWSQISDSYFNCDFWYRKEFDYTPGGRHPFLDFDGINWKADVWLNGMSVGRIEGAFIRGHFPVEGILRPGRNVLAVKVERNAHPGAVKEKTARWTGYNGGVLGADNPTFHASIGWDWMTTVRGRNCGIWNDVRLVEKGPVEVSDPVLLSRVGPDGRASVTASVRVSGNAPGKVRLEGWIGDIFFSKDVDTAGEVSFSPADFPQLKDCDLALWWPVGYGEPVLHDAGFAVRVDGELSDSLHFKAGIREMAWDVQDGALRLFINGKRLVPQGGNWGFSEHNLVFGKREYEIALDYHRQMNINMIRNWVGQVADEEFYDACDRYGVLVWQDFWLANPGDGPNPNNEDMFLTNAADWVSRIRRHPCLALYCGRNEGDPPASLDRALREDVVARLHPSMLYISNSADGIVSGHGPYRALPLEAYYADQSGKLHSERGLPNVPTWESLQRMLPQADQWPQGELWGKHDFTTDGAQSVRTYNALLETTWGKALSAREYTYLAQWLNYEGCRTIFESANAAGRNGMILWMTHSSWPSMVFCTYDYYFEPGGAFFGCRKGCEPLHIQYNRATRQVEVVNLCCGNLTGLTAALGIYSGKGGVLDTQTRVIDSPEDSTVPCFEARLPSDQEVCLLKLRLLDADGVLLSDNFYMIPSAAGGPEGGLRVLRTLPAARVTRTVKKTPRGLEVTLHNQDTLPALMVRLILQDRKGNEILPVSYSDNYFTLLPGEETTVEIACYDGRDAGACRLELQQIGDFCRPALSLVKEELASLVAGQCLLLGGQLAPGTLPQTFENGALVTSDLTRWTSGFFPGTCWYAASLSGREDVQELARAVTEPLLDVDAYYRDHDIGFQVMCSAGLAYKMTGDERYLPAIRRGAELLASRFVPATGTLMSWDSSRPVCKVIIDNMMNLELLTFASRQFGVPEWEAIAQSHADKTMANHFREDASSYHLLEYDLQSGEVLVKKTVQGYSDSSAWSRGQAWGLYGYTMMFRETGEERYLQQAQRIARYLLPLLAERPVPAWDFRAPEPMSAQADASAAAVMASALLELSGCTDDPELAGQCFRQAEATLEELASPRYLAAPGELGGFLLGHSTGFYRHASEVDVPLTYADYYFLEALVRYYQHQ